MAIEDYEERTAWWHPYGIRAPNALKKTEWWHFNGQMIEPDRLTHSYSVPQTLFVAVRVILFLYALTVLGCTFAKHFLRGYWFAYLTHLTFLSETIYLGISAYHSIRSFKNPGSSIRNQHYIFTYIHQLLYEMNIVYHIVVPIVAWSFLQYEIETDFLRWINFSVHGMDGIMMVVDFVLNRNQFILSHIIPILFIALLFGLYSWFWKFFYTSVSTWVYPFLSWDRPFLEVLISYLGVFLGIFICAFLVFLAHQAKYYIIAKLDVDKIASIHRHTNRSDYTTSALSNMNYNNDDDDDKNDF